MGTIRALADTSVFIGIEQARFDDASLPTYGAVSVVTIGELKLGVLAAVDTPSRAARLRILQEALTLQPLPIDERVSDAWAELTVALRDTGRKLATNDGWIAATAIAHGLPLVTQDRDYDGVPGLDVVTL
jgi:predicted nucleic acid-binding protein